MQIITYKTNISNEQAIGRVAPVLNQLVGSSNWQLNTGSRHKELTVFTYSVLDEDRIIRAIRKAGYRAENLEDYRALY